MSRFFPQTHNLAAESFIHLLIFNMSFISVPGSVDTGDTVLKNRHRACPHGAYVLVVDIKTSVEDKGCAPQKWVVSTGGVQNDL